VREKEKEKERKKRRERKSTFAAGLKVLCSTTKGKTGKPIFQHFNKNSFFFALLTS
jgi:hypothetical protein